MKRTFRKYPSNYVKASEYSWDDWTDEALLDFIKTLDSSDDIEIRFARPDSEGGHCVIFKGTVKKLLAKKKLRTPYGEALKLDSFGIDLIDDFGDEIDILVYQ